jgi:putative ubiquitin-RnfH superfamily antitoxin RatB of RatAB toxin-antitoxin module
MATRAGDTSENRIRVEVAYALRDRQVLLTRELEEGCTVEQAIRRSGILEAFPEIDVARVRVGIFGREVSLDVQLRDGDRVEIYRQLIVDPKEMRRRNAGGSAPRSRRS